MAPSTVRFVGVGVRSTDAAQESSAKAGGGKRTKKRRVSAAAMRAAKRGVMVEGFTLFKIPTALFVKNEVERSGRRIRIKARIKIPVPFGWIVNIALTPDTGVILTLVQFDHGSVVGQSYGTTPSLQKTREILRTAGVIRSIRARRNDTGDNRGIDGRVRSHSRRNS